MEECQSPKLNAGGSNPPSLVTLEYLIELEKWAMEHSMPKVVIDGKEYYQW